MDRKLIAILATGAVVIAVTLVVGARYQPQTAIPLKDRRFLHCPECRHEVNYSEKAEEEGCQQCRSDEPLVATRERLKDTPPPPNPLVRLFAPVFLEVNLLIAAVIWYQLAKRSRSADEDYLYTECGQCRKKLRYRVSRVGQAGQCPRCKARFVFPPAAEDEEEEGGPWWKKLSRLTRGRRAQGGV